MGKIIYLFFQALLLVGCGMKEETPDKVSPDSDSIPMLVMQIQKSAKLYTAEYQVHKIVTFADTMALKGQFFSKEFRIDLPASRRRVAIPVTASIKAYIDFKDFSSKNIKKNGNKLEVILPDPQVTMTSTVIDHEHIKQKVSFLRSKFTDEKITMIQQQGRAEILRAVPQLGIEENARLSATRQLVPLFEQLGYDAKDVTITFSKNYRWNNLPQLIRTVE
jgi:hypothetical protein